MKKIIYSLALCFLLANVHAQQKVLSAKKPANGDGYTIILNLNKSHGWYDFSVLASGSNKFERRYAGHVETGKESFTDPVMGRV